MALYDNKYWLLSHIRNSFISTDDTGMCELVMASEEGLRKKLKETYDYYPDDESSDDDLSHESYDLQPDMDFGIRCRSNTAARLEKLEMVKRKASKIKHVKWEMSKTPISQQQLEEMFVRKELKRPPKVPVKSLLSQTLQQYTNVPTNPFIEFAKFDGSGQVNVATKSYRIFLTMLPENQRNYPIHICCIGSARIHELIGLTLLKCSTQYEEHQWHPVNKYGLYITEDDGEVDRDFPCLDAKENISKFGFTCLGLVEHAEPSKGVTFDQHETIAIFGQTSFESSKKPKEAKIDLDKITTDLQLIDIHNKSMEAPLYRSYTVAIINKMRAKVDILLGVSGEKIEIDPVQQVSKFSFAKQKAINHDIDTIAACEIVEAKSSKTLFKLVYCNQPIVAETVASSNSSSSPAQHFKHYDFEADPQIADEIAQKISLILDLRSSETRKAYLAMLERKQYKKKALL